jgi:hypothetical protein
VDLAAAGLFHSIYGTSGFADGTLALVDREALAQIIGAKAERLAYLFCARTRESLFANVVNAGPYHLYDRFRQEDTPIDRETLCQLLTLDPANSLEQLPRLTEQMTL